PPALRLRLPAPGTVPGIRLAGAAVRRLLLVDHRDRREARGDGRGARAPDGTGPGALRRAVAAADGRHRHPRGQGVRRPQGVRLSACSAFWIGPADTSFAGLFRLTKSNRHTIEALMRP